jgi:phospholipid/cholesterol/gamma-HCH transport system ATP-binding protein
MAVPEPIVEAEELRKNFDTNPVLRGVSFVLTKGETLVVMGGSGAGKTVLLRLVAGLIRPDGGSLRVFGRNIENLSEEALLPLRRRMGYVFQSAALFDSLSVYENVAYPLREHTTLGEAEIHERVVRNLSVVGLSSDVLPLLPSELSGGMRKRVGIARALSVEPDMLLFDEPTGGLDPTNSKLVADLMLELRGGVCDTAMVVTHDVELARTVADRVAVLIKGRFEALGPADEVLSGHNPAVQAFLAGSNVARASGGAGR